MSTAAPATAAPPRDEPGEDSTTAAAAAAAAHRNGELSHQQILRILTGLMAGMFLASLDQTIVSTAIRTIADDLNGLDQQAWVTTAYLITSTIATPIYGKLSDLYGRKVFFQAAIVIFVIGSAACSFATSMHMLAVFRAFQGLGAGGLMSLAMAIIGDIVAPRDRAKYQGYIMAVFGTSTVLGPVIGGFLSGRSTILSITGWRWVFLVNVPIGIFAFFLVQATLHLHHVRHEARIDWFGTAALIVCLVPLLTVAEQGRTWGWSSHKSVWCYVIGAVGLVLFILAEYLAKDDALIPLRIFRSRLMVVALLSGFMVGAGMFGGMMLLPQFYLQIIHGSSPTRSGLQMLPMVLGVMSASIASGLLIQRTGRIKAFPIFGAALMTGMLFWLSQIGADTDLWKTMILMFFFGFGLGNTMQPLVLAVQSAAEPKDIGMSTSAATFFRQIGGTLGVAIFLSVMFNTLTDNIKNAFTTARTDPTFLAALKDPTVLKNPVNASFVKAISSGNTSAFSQVSSDSSFINQLDARLAHPFKVGFASSLHTVFLCAGVAVAIALVCLLFLPNITLSRQSAAARRAAAAREANGQTDGTDGADAEPAVLPEDGRDELAVAPATRRGHDRPTTLTDDLMGGEEAAAEQASSPAPRHAAPEEPVFDPRGLGAGVWGTVKHSTGAPFAGAHVTVAAQSGQQFGVCETDHDGVYHQSLPHGGTFLVIIAAEGASPLASLVPVADQTVRHDVVLQGDGRLQGRVTQRTSTTDGGADSEPVTDAHVTLTDVTGQVVGSQQTGVDGSYHFERLSAGDYVLTVQSSSHRPSAQMVQVQGTAPVTCDIDLALGGHLTGVVRDADDDRPVRRAMVTLLDAHGQVAATLVTGDDGAYRFDDLEAGAYTLTASGYAPVALGVMVEAGSTGEQTVWLGDQQDAARRGDGNTPDAWRA